MIPRLGLGAVELFVLLFAVLGFVFVPLGRRTALEHTQAVLSTPAAKDARQELGEAVVRTLDRLRTAWGSSSPSPKDPPELRVKPAAPLRPPPFTLEDAGPPDVSL